MTDNSGPIPVKDLRGRVTLGLYAKGSKSEREAVFVDTEKGQFILRRKSGPAFADATLNGFVGQTVECDGFLVGTTLLAEHIRLVQ